MAGPGYTRWLCFLLLPRPLARLGFWTAVPTAAPIWPLTSPHAAPVARQPIPSCCHPQFQSLGPAGTTSGILALTHLT